MKKSQIFMLLLGLAAATNACAQADVWSLERCIRHAQEASLSIQQANIEVKRAELSERQAKSNQIPGMDANFNLNQQFGRTLNFFTNTYDNVSNTSNSVGVNSGVLVYGGGQVRNSIRQAKTNQSASRADAEQIGNTLALQVAQAFLNILLSEEQVKNAKKRVGQSQDQLKRTDQLIQVGTLAQVERLNFVAQIARDEQAAVAAQNQLDLAFLNLKQLLLLEPDVNMQIERPAVNVPVDANPDGFMLRAVFNNAINTQPNVRAADLRIDVAKMGVSIARAAYFPRLQAFANLNSGFDSRWKDNVTRTTVPYTEQISNNFGQAIGISASIPIYQQGQTKIAVQQATLDVQRAQITATQTRQQLKTDIQTAIANAKAAEKQFEASQKTFDAMQAAFENSKKRYELGALNSLELTTAQNNRDIAENDLVLSKFDYIFKLKVLDFYNGKKISLN